MASAAGAGACAVHCKLGGRRDVVVVHAHRGKCVGRVAGTAVIVARDVSGVLAHGFYAVVTTEAGTSYLQVIHADDWQKVVLGVARLAVVLRQDVCNRPGG